MKDPQNKIIDQATKTLIDKLLLEKIPLAGIARVVGVSEPWLQSYVNAKYEAVPQQVEVTVKKRRLMIQGDELWSFVGNKSRINTTNIKERDRSYRILRTEWKTNLASKNKSPWGLHDLFYSGYPMKKD